MNTEIMITAPNETEMKTLELVLKDLCVKQISDIRHLSEDTIETHTRLIREKTHAHSIGVAAFRLCRAGLIPQEVLDRAFEGNWQEGVK